LTLTHSKLRICE